MQMVSNHGKGDNLHEISNPFLGGGGGNRKKNLLSIECPVRGKG